MAEPLPTLDAVRAAAPILGLYLERATLIAAYHGPGGTYAVYRPRLPAPGLPPPSPMMCTLRDRPALVQLEDEPAWYDEEDSAAVARALADGVLRAAPGERGNLSVTEDDVERVLAPAAEVLEALETSLARLVRFRELNAPGAIVENEIAMARARWRIVADCDQAAYHAWPAALREVVRELRLTRDPLDAPVLEKLARIVDALTDIAVLRRAEAHPSFVESTRNHAARLWDSVASAPEVADHPWPRSLASVAEELGIVVRRTRPG